LRKDIERKKVTSSKKNRSCVKAIVLHNTGGHKLEYGEIGKR
jgi:hypothetical protein